MSDPYAWGTYPNSADQSSYYAYSYQQQQPYSQQNQQQNQSWSYKQQQQQHWQQHPYDPQTWQQHQQYQQGDPHQQAWSQQQQQQQQQQQPGAGWTYPTSYYHIHQQTQHRQSQAAQAAASMTAALQGATQNQTPSHPTLYPPQHPEYPQHPQAYNHQGYPPTPPSTEPSWDQVKALSCCFRTYRTLKDKEKHMQQHVQCPQCSYSAAKVLVDDHLRVEHNVVDKSSKSKPDGIVPFNAPKLDTPEALNAWIQARKKNWPSKANVERKEQEKKKRQLDRTDKARQEPKEKKQKTTEDSKTIVGDYGSSSEGEEDDESKVRDNSIASDEEGDDIMDPDRDAVTSKDPKAMGRVGSPPPTRPRKLCKYFMSKRGCLHGDKCTFSHERPPRPEPRQKKPPVTKTRSNLLRKLLEKEIEQERNVLLQCFRHIVDNNFFQ